MRLVGGEFDGRDVSDLVSTAPFLRGEQRYMALREGPITRDEGMGDEALGLAIPPSDAAIYRWDMEMGRFVASSVEEKAADEDCQQGSALSLYVEYVRLGAAGMTPNLQSLAQAAGTL
jgi:hypothetical protein